MNTSAPRFAVLLVTALLSLPSIANGAAGAGGIHADCAQNLRHETVLRITDAQGRNHQLIFSSDAMEKDSADKVDQRQCAISAALLSTGKSTMVCGCESEHGVMSAVYWGVHGKLKAAKATLNCASVEKNGEVKIKSRGDFIRSPRADCLAKRQYWVGEEGTDLTAAELDVYMKSINTHDENWQLGITPSSEMKAETSHPEYTGGSGGNAGAGQGK